MITIDNLPFSIVYGPVFHRVVQFFAPWYNPPARTTLSWSMVPTLFRAAKEHMKVQMLCVEPSVWYLNLPGGTQCLSLGDRALVATQQHSGWGWGKQRQTGSGVPGQLLQVSAACWASWLSAHGGQHHSHHHRPDSFEGRQGSLSQWVFWSTEQPHLLMYYQVAKELS